MHQNINSNDQTAVMQDISHELQVINNGPSTVDELILICQLPISLRNSLSQIVALESIHVNASYKNNVLQVSQLHNNLFSDVSEGDIKDGYDTRDDNEDEYEETIKLTTDPIIAVDYSPKVQGQQNRRRRRRRELMSDMFQDNTTVITYDYLDKLPTNKTIFFDCNGDNVDIFECVSFSITLTNFQRSTDPIQIFLSFSVKLNEIDKILGDEKNLLVLQTNLELQNPLDEEGMSLKIRQQLPFTIFYKQQSQKVAYWIYLAAGGAGLLLLLILSYILYKVGFFRRTKKEELERLTKEVSSTGKQETNFANLNQPFFIRLQGDQTYSKNMEEDDKYF